MARLNKQAGEILIYEPIGADMFGGVPAKDVADLLSELGSRDVIVRINSPGGSAADGVAIYNRLQAHRGQVTVQVDAEAASAASIVAMAGKQIIMSQGSQMMIHDPWIVMAGGAEELRGKADYLDQIRENCIDIYTSRTGASREDVGDWMAAETWFNASGAVEAGFADSVGTTMAVAAFKDRKLFQFANTPPELLENKAPLAVEPEQWSPANKMRQKRMAEIREQYRHEPA